MSSEREGQARAFLADCGLEEARRESLLIDASTRRYERVFPTDGPSLVFMDAPPAAESEPLGPEASPGERLAAGYNAMSRLSAGRVDAFVATAGFLRSRGLSAPEVFAFDPGMGFALVEDLGDGLYARLLKSGGDERLFYRTAVEALAQLHEEPPPAVLRSDEAVWPLLTYDELALKTGVDLFVEWLPKFDPRVVLDGEAIAAWDSIWRPIRRRAEQGASVFCHRDYHAENLLWLPERPGVARVGMVDFQDCVLAHPCWDLHSLLQDARRDVPTRIENECLGYYFELRPDLDASQFMEDYTALATLNECRIIGIFSRLVTRDNKPRYRDFMPRMWGHLEANLIEMDDLRAWFNAYVPKEVRQ